MGNRIYAIAYGDPPITIKEVEGETFGIDSDGSLRFYDAAGICILAFASMTWTYIENVTKKMRKANAELYEKFTGLKPAKND